MTRSLATLLIAALLTGCVVTQSRDGRYQFGFVEPGQTVAEFPSAGGPSRLRRHFDGTYGLYFPQQLSQYRIGKYDDIQLVAHHTDGGKTAALVERRRGNCVDYELITITRDRVGKNAIRSGCQSRLDAAVVDGKLVMRERVDARARLWVWSHDGIRTAREPAPQRVATPAQRPSQSPSQRTARSAPAPAPRPSTRAASAPAAAPPRAAPAAIRLPPAGSISREAEQPVTVILDRDG